MIDDHIVKEVRKIRDQIASECNYDIHLYFEKLRKDESKSQKETPVQERKQKPSLRKSKITHS